MMSEILKCLEVDILLINKSSEVYLKYKEVESYARYLKNHNELFKKFLQKQDKINCLVELHNQTNLLNPRANINEEKKIVSKNLLEEINNLISKFNTECENIFFEDAKNRYMLIDNILSNYQVEYEKILSESSLEDAEKRKNKVRSKFK
jgi:hypothetical protein